MAGTSNFPTALDDNTSLYEVVDSVSAVIAEHHNNPKEAIIAIQTKLGIFNTAVATSIDYRLGHPSGHAHNGASGQGQKVDPTSLNVPSGGVPSGLSLYDHLMNTAIHGGPGVPHGARHIHTFHHHGSLPNGASLGLQFEFGRTMNIENVSARLKRAPSGATTAIDVNIGVTSVWQASALFRPIFAPGALAYRNASPNLVTYPSGALMIVDVDAVGSNDPGQDLTITFIFREI